MNEAWQNVAPYSSQWLDSLVRASWQGAIVIALAWLLARSRFVSPRAKCWVWRLACAKLLVSLVWLPVVTIPLLPALPNAPAAVSHGDNPLPLVTEVAAIASSPAVDAHRMPVEASSARDFSWSNLLIGAWAVGLLMMIASTVRHMARVRRLVTESQPCADADVIELLRAEAARLIVRHIPQVRCSPRAHSPLLTGFWRPIVVLPNNTVCADASALQLMLAHELAHQKRQDLAWNWLPTVATWIFFFHPLVWLMRRSWGETQEEACDELLIQRHIVSSATYGRFLLKLAAQGVGDDRPSLLAMGVLGTYHDLERRLLSMSRVRTFSTRRVTGAAVLCMLVATIIIVPWRIAAQEPARLVAQEKSTSAAGGGELPGRIYVNAFIHETNKDGGEEYYNGMISIDPNTGKWMKLAENGHLARVSPDNAQILVEKLRQPLVPKNNVTEVYVGAINDPQLRRILENASRPQWSPDGKQLLYNVGTMEGDKGWRGRHWTIDLATGTKKPLSLPETDEVDDWSRHGNWLVTTSDRHEPFGSGYQIYVMHPDGSDQHRVSDGEGLNCYPRFHPDGTRLVFTRQRNGQNSIWVVDTDGQNRRQIYASKDDGTDFPEGSCWSPDGKSLIIPVFDWQINENGKKYSAAGIYKRDRLVIVAPDGKMRGTVELSGKPSVRHFGNAEWR